MRIGLVVADTGPLHCLVLTGDITLLPRLFEKVVTPERVRDELAHIKAPEAVRARVAAPPSWCEIRPVEDARGTDELAALDAGERDAIALALATEADLLLMDDQGGVAAARRRGFAVTGTLGLLDLAARKGLIDLATAFARLTATSFYYRQGLWTPCWRSMRRSHEQFARHRLCPHCDPLVTTAGAQAGRCWPRQKVHKSRT